VISRRGLGGFSAVGGLDLKQKMLEIERAEINQD
jgi:O6-methylguanine-DNA--protein-cysteine methyltransferase